MFRVVTAVAFVTVGCLGLASEASAISLTQDNALGLVNDGIPSSPANEVIYINTLIGMAVNTGPTLIGTETYTRYDDSCGSCPAATTTGSAKDESGGNTGSFGSGWTYIVAKYDADQAGSLVWYVAGLSGTFDVPTALNGKGVSHISYYGPGTPPEETEDDPVDVVPEPASLLLLGAGLSAAAVRARRKARRQMA
jgi:hypothetical protein